MRVRWLLILLILVVPLPFASAATSGSVLAAHGCTGCHAVTRPAADYSLADRIAEKGPNLWYAGSKLQRDWLTQWLAAPTAISGIRFDSLRPIAAPFTHPQVTGQSLPQVVNALMSLTDEQMPVGLMDLSTPTSRMDRIRGRILFGKQQQCFACHRTLTRYGVAVGGQSAPRLTDASRRLNPDWVLAFLMDPKRYTPIPRMPIYRGDTYTDYGLDQMRLLTRYIAAMGASQ